MAKAVIRPLRSGARIYTPAEYSKIRRPIPVSWRKAAGMLKGKLPKDPVAWQRQIRSEWDQRLARQIELAHSRDDR
jgi:hypothetical protein